jgi:phospholipid/cholesterol/gamma-HCH transport system substrate-binding protein
MKKDWRERELTMEVIVGAFVVMVFLGLGYFTIILSKEAWFSQKTEMQVTFNNVMGLRDGDSVVVRGMPIGKVKELELTEVGEECVGVCVTLMLDKPVEIHEGYQIKIISTSILGGRQLQIDEGPATAPVVFLDRYRGKDPYDIMEDAADIVNAARTEIIRGEVFAKIRNVTDQVTAMVTRVNAGKGILGKILAEKDTLYTDLEASAATLRNMMARVEKGEGTVGKLLSDDSSLYDELAEAVQSLRVVAKNIEEGKGTVGRLLSEDAQLYEDLAAAVASLKRITERIEKGEGTVGRIVSDDTLYEEVEATVGEVRAAIDDFRETAPITTFSSIFFGAF